MEQKEQVYQLLEKRKGTLSRKEALNAGINPNTLKRMLDAGEVYSPISGILVQEDRLEDTYYSINPSIGDVKMTQLNRR